MSNFSYDDFAVLVRSFDLESLDLGSLRIVPLNVAPSMAQAINGTIPDVPVEGATVPALEEGKAYLPLDKDGKTKVSTNVTVQHKSDGYCRLVGHLVPEVGEDGTALSATARAFVLYHSPTEGDIPVDKVLAVASLKEGFEIGEGCYPSFTITTVNNYQSVAFNPNAFATVEDLKNINGLDGLHIAFDQATGDIKLLDKDGNVIDQANLPIKADVIIADGEEGYKYVKTDVQQDIHAAKAWMPEGETALDAVEPVDYVMKHAALVVESAGDSSTDNVVGIAVARKNSENENENEVDEEGNVLLDVYAFDETDETTVNNVSGDAVQWLAKTHEEVSQRDLSGKGYSLRYSLDAFVWTVGEAPEKPQTFAEKLNKSALELGFHEGDDIALGTNLETLNVMVGEALDPEEYMHSEENMGQREAEIAEQRNLAKEELVAWNAQHPGLTHNAKAGTIISSDGVDIRYGKLRISDGDDKRYVLSTNFNAEVPEDLYELEDSDRGLAISAVDASGGEVQVLTINASSYISGAPICMAMLEIKNGDKGLEGEPIRRTACFDCAMSERMSEDETPISTGIVDVTITDKRSNSYFKGDVIVEISPVYIPGETAPEGGADIEIETAPEMLPALNTVNTVASANDYKEFTCTCPQIIDWANSVNLGVNGARLFAIVKVY